MSHKKTTAEIERSLNEVFAAIDEWFDKPEPVINFARADGTWSIAQILEHVYLTNHFLLLTLNKHADKAAQRFAKGDQAKAAEEAVEAESDLDFLLLIGVRGSFHWKNPDHMEPTGDVSLAEIRSRLKQQLAQCLDLNVKISEGVGALAKVTMTVNDLGKIDLYQWLYFISQHARRHLQQLESAYAEAITD